MDPILVTGGTGTLGRHVVRRLKAQTGEVRVLTRRPRPDEGNVRFMTGELLTGLGVDAAVSGAATIVHCVATKEDDIATRNLVNAAARAGHPHLVYISVVGADRVPVRSRADRLLFGYYEMKRKAEQVVAGSGLPWTTIRATQFHDLLLLVLEYLAKLPIVPVPSDVFVQPVEADEVAERLVELALGPPSGLVPDIAGPRVYAARDLIRGYLSATNRHRPLLPVRIPGTAARAVRAGAILAPQRAVGVKTWEAFLAAHLPANSIQPLVLRRSSLAVNAAPIVAIAAALIAIAWYWRRPSQARP
jgi:uncharacterized protein YbjT (DUF2867 family)